MNTLKCTSTIFSKKIFIVFIAPHIEENRNIVGTIQGLEEHDQTAAIMYSNQDPVLASSSSGMMKNNASSSRNVSPHEVIFQMDPRNAIAK